MRTVKLTKESTKDILENLLKRSPNNYGKFESTVAQILDKVKNEGDAALFAYTKEFDKADVTKETIRVTDAEIEEAYAQIDPALLGVIRKALVNIRKYHEKQLVYKWDKRNYARPESDSVKQSRCLCTWRKSSLPIIRTYEYRTCKSSRSTAHCYDNTSWKRRKSYSKYISCSERSWSNKSI